ncbi:phosphatase PAP2 family protein [Kiloniella sp.]|uniref:phosphatase PAP2 family protein n=1 Tax=Kiloniella sp. TaxID=1938587 RepID=UPI003A93730B
MMPDSVLVFLTHFGEIQFLIAATVCIYWIICPRLGTRLWFALCLSSSVQQTLKMTFAQPRPYWLNPDLVAIEKSTSYGMPSGHAQTPPLFYGILAKSSRRRWAYFLAAVIVILTGWTRITGNVHSTEQVLTGWIIGVFLLIAIFLLEKPVSQWWQKSTLIIRVSGSFAFCAVLMGVGLWSASNAGQQIVPAIWVENAGHPLRPVKADNIIIVPGLLFGWLLGLAFLDGKYPPKPENKLKLALRPLLGLPPLALLLDVAPGKEIELILIVTFVVGTLAGLWSSYGAPFLFKILKI